MQLLLLLYRAHASRVPTVKCEHDLPERSAVVVLAPVVLQVQDVEVEARQVSDSQDPLLELEGVHLHRVER